MKLKKFLKYFLYIFLISILIFVWNKISWVFNPKAVFRYLSYQFKKEIEAEIKILKKEKIQEIKRENSIEIPKIKTSAPLVLVKDETQVSKALDKGVVLWPNSALPGKSGQTIIMGHSAPPNWPKIKYDWVFSQINNLGTGDEIFVYFEEKEFKYKVFKKIFLKKNEEIPKEFGKSKNILVLISCWPPGQDLRRIAVLAENIDKKSELL